MSEDRADYMMEAFLDEQNTLIRPLVSRKLHLVKTLDGRASLIERLLEEKRKKFLHSVTTNTPSKKGHSPPAAELELIEALEDELEQLSEEKLGTLNQLMDLVRRPYDTILEVEAVLQAAADRETPDDETDRRASYHSGRRGAAMAAAPPPASPPEEELWCFCRKPDDGRQMVACDNAKCDLVWWHIDCLQNYIQANRIGTPPPEDDSSNKKWHCPVCIAQEIVNREENGGQEKQRRRRRT